MKAARFTLILLTLLSVCFLPGCARTKNIARKITINKHPTKNIAAIKPECTDIPQTQNPTITVWIHGTRFFPAWCFKNLYYCDAGLNLAKNLDNKYYMREQINVINRAGAEQYPLDSFYIYGWSGAINFKTRKSESIKLYNQLVPLVKSYKQQYGCRPTVKILCHSHGGNIALNLADCKQPDDDLIIDELVLLACPVQQATAHLIQNPMFKKIYALYSRIDMLQVLDPQGLYELENQQGSTTKPTLFSARCFPNQENLSQVKIKVDGRAIMHTEFSSHAFLELLPNVIQEINSWDNQDHGIITPPESIKRLLCIYTDGRKIGRTKNSRRIIT